MTATSEHGEDVVHAATASAAHTFLDSIHAMLVVNVSLFFVEENLVSASHFFELFWITALVRMILDRELSVGLLYLIHGRILFNPESFVEFGVLYFFLGATAAHSVAEASLFELLEGESSATAEKHG